MTACALTAFLVASVWLGFVLSISFMESWLKFRAKGLTLPVALAIGSLVFRALNIVEWTLAAILCFTLLACGLPSADGRLYAFVAVTAILMLQTFLLLPRLRQRARVLAEGGKNPASGFHLWYVIFEVLKVATLILFLGMFYRGQSAAATFS